MYFSFWQNRYYFLLLSANFQLRKQSVPSPRAYRLFKTLYLILFFKKQHFFYCNSGALSQDQLKPFIKKICVFESPWELCFQPETWKSWQTSEMKTIVCFWVFLQISSLNNITKLASKSVKLKTIIEIIIESTFVKFLLRLQKEFHTSPAFWPQASPWLTLQS